MRGTRSKNVEGWTLDVIAGSVGNLEAERNCTDDNSWYGSGADPISNTGGSIKTTLNGDGKARQDFGNCYSHGIVQVNLNGNKIAKATEDEMSKKIDFDFNNGDIPI